MKVVYILCEKREMLVMVPQMDNVGIQTIVTKQLKVHSLGEHSIVIPVLQLLLYLLFGGKEGVCLSNYTTVNLSMYNYHFHHTKHNLTLTNPVRLL